MGQIVVAAWAGLMVGWVGFGWVMSAGTHMIG